jgi:hypothetical protein
VSNKTLFEVTRALIEAHSTPISDYDIERTVLYLMSDEALQDGFRFKRIVVKLNKQLEYEQAKP